MLTKRTRSRAGFTMPEVLVAVAMVGVLAAVVMPTVIGQVSKGEISRVVQDIQAVEQAAGSFRADVGKWPGSLWQLVTKPAATDLDPAGTQFGQTGVDKWNGPYLARGALPITADGPYDGNALADTVLPTSLGRVIAFDNLTWSGNTFFTIVADSLLTVDAEQVSLQIDGETLISLADDTHGKIRFATGTPNILYYFASPLK